ncbi:MAG: hypothetical protein RL885_31455 [Planctomycetota bacterium]
MSDQKNGCVVGCIVIVAALLLIAAFALFSPEIFSFIKDLVKSSSF